MKKVLFLTGTRADYGKLKSLMNIIEKSTSFQCSIFATGMHTLSRYGNTVNEIYKNGFQDIHTYMNQIKGDGMDIILANTIHGLSRYVHENRPDLIVVHGDRVETLAGAIVGTLNNILVAHIEGGELSGTVDELIRHSVSKLAHIHFVANAKAADRLKQLGEDSANIYEIGSPDHDVMNSRKLPELDYVKQYYDIDFSDYAIGMLHPVTTEVDEMAKNAIEFTRFIKSSARNYILIYPNNDLGCEHIFNAYKDLEKNPRVKIFPSLRFEYFLSLLKNAEFIIGNSSAGIFEAPFFAVPTINIGTRQKNRFFHRSIVNCGYNEKEVYAAFKKIKGMVNLSPAYHYGKGDSAKKFLKVLSQKSFWSTSKQKQFLDFVALAKVSSIN